MLERYNSILGTIRTLCPTAHIGGGAVRDTLLERPIKDVDLFLGQSTLQDAAKLLRSDFGFVKVGEWARYEMFSDPAVVAVGKFEKADETIPICLIGLSSPLNMQNNTCRFDFGACMAAWDGREVYTAPEYKADVEAKTFTLCRADNQAQFAYSMSRFRKLTASRYEGWKLAVLPQFEELAREHSFRADWYRAGEPLEICGIYYEGRQTLHPKTR
jgi:hypothetical protein